MYWGNTAPSPPIKAPPILALQAAPVSYSEAFLKPFIKFQQLGSKFKLSGFLWSQICWMCVYMNMHNPVTQAGNRSSSLRSFHEDSGFFPLPLQPIYYKYLQ